MVDSPMFFFSEKAICTKFSRDHAVGVWSKDEAVLDEAVLLHLPAGFREFKRQ